MDFSLYFGYVWNRYNRIDVRFKFMFTVLLACLLLIQFPVFLSPAQYFGFIWPIIIYYFFHMYFIHFSYQYYFWLSFWPQGVPLLGGLFILPSEMLSYAARPIGTLIRPRVKLLGGLYLTGFMHYYINGWSFMDFVYLYLFMVYESIVTLVQWFIVGLVSDFTKWEPHDL